MALGTQVDTPSVKYGAAEALLFGVPESNDFDILESTSATSSFGTDMQVKNEVGNTVGIVLGDPKLEITMNGMGAGPPKALGAVTEFSTFLTAVGTSEDPATSSSTKSFCVKSVKQDNSNEDFVKYEVQAEHYYNVDYGTSKDLSTGQAEHGD